MAFKISTRKIFLSKYEDWGKNQGNYFFLTSKDTSQVGKCNMYRQKDKVLTAIMGNK